MYKPQSLRKHLAAAIPDLKRDPDKLSVFVDHGNTVSTGTTSLSFEYRYKLNLIITDYAGDADAIMVPLLAWTHVHQPELLNDPEKRKKGIAFEVDFNSHESVDISITLDLTEGVRVKKGENGRLDITHVPEPQPTPDYTDQFWTLYNGDDLFASWYTPAPVTQ